MNKIVTKQLFQIHAQLTGSSEPLSEASWNALKEAAAAPYEQNESEYYIYRTIAAKSAKLGCELTRLRPFAEKNELTALVASFTMMEINGCKLTGYKKDLDELKSFFKKNEIESAEYWLNAHTAQAAEVFG